MSINFESYCVSFTDYAEGHYIKKFERKYKEKWKETRDSIESFLERIDTVIGVTNRAEVIFVSGKLKIIKLEFKIAGTNESAKSSGNRAIVFIDDENRNCDILLVYSKNEICQPNETQKWQSEIKTNFPEIWKLF